VGEGQEINAVKLIDKIEADDPCREGRLQDLRALSVSLIPPHISPRSEAPGCPRNRQAFFR
jgi:hypothetical protein